MPKAREIEKFAAGANSSTISVAAILDGRSGGRQTHLHKIDEQNQ
jgi:hypothetical protein